MVERRQVTEAGGRYSYRPCLCHYFDDGVVWNAVNRQCFPKLGTSHKLFPRILY